jgi:Fur family ferric uptake transcriptional regulator
MADTAFAEHARSAILDTGERVTPARVRVLGELLGAGRALSHHDLEHALGADAIDRVTLYRVLDWLVERGFSCRTLGADRVFRFSAQRGSRGHAHFECSVCGRVLCLAAAAPQPQALPEGFRAESVALTVRGRCADCNDT